jgi:predicted nucleotidyltransferase
LPSEALRENREEILRSAERNGLSDVRVFGSVARRDDTIHSDIDILVAAHEGTSLMELAGFVAEVEDLTGFDVDVVSDGNVREDSEILREARSL